MFEFFVINLLLNYLLSQLPVPQLPVPQPAVTVCKLYQQWSRGRALGILAAALNPRHGGLESLNALSLGLWPTHALFPNTIPNCRAPSKELVSGG